MPKKPERLGGSWRLTGDHVAGETTFAWMENGFFLTQQFDLQQQKGIEYDENTPTVRFRLMQTNGSNFTYTLEDDTLWLWFGDQGSDNVSRATFNQDGSSYIKLP